VGLRVIEIEDKSSTEQGVEIRSGPELCLDSQWWLPRGSITRADRQHLQPVKERFFSSRPRKSFGDDM